ncbi:hypothetical protein L9F63_015082, partial [Diploptera punctata]
IFFQFSSVFTRKNSGGVLLSFSGNLSLDMRTFLCGVIEYLLLFRRHMFDTSFCPPLRPVEPIAFIQSLYVKRDEICSSFVTRSIVIFCLL